MSCDYDMKSNMLTTNVIAPAVHTTTAASSTIDTTGYKALTLALYVGAGGITFTGTNRIDFVVNDGDDGSTWAPVTDDKVILDHGASISANVTAGAPAGSVRSIATAQASADTTKTTVGYIGKKQYVQVVATFGGTHATGTLVSVDAQLGHPMSAPVNQSAYEV